jgi:NRAMP (natural resistance-associated macrophage protein)-like metal ion transporter
MCVRLAYLGQVTLAEAQARDQPRGLRYLNWAIAEISAVLTDLPEVIGIGIAGQIFFGWPYYVGVLASLLTTMVFLGMLRWGLRKLEFLIFGFVGIMSVALFVEMSFVGVHWRRLMEGWTIDVLETKQSDLFAVTGILGAVVMPHNLYLHSATCFSRRVERTVDSVHQAIHFCTWEPVMPVLFSFFINAAVVTIAAERVQGQAGADQVGLTNFCDYFRTLKGGCFLWGLALLAAGQSSASKSMQTHRLPPSLIVAHPHANPNVLRSYHHLCWAVRHGWLFTNSSTRLVAGYSDETRGDCPLHGGQSHVSFGARLE